MLLRRLSFVAAIGALVAVADAITKAGAEAALSREMIALTPFLNLRLGFNPGISYGLLPTTSTAGIVGLIAVQLMIVAGLVVVGARSRQLLEQAALGFIVGGAVGNVIDRARDGLVTDFLDLHLHGWHWPTFNLADVAITCGAALLLWTAIRPRPAQVPVR
jgi:signal peptidase II